jgi:hypothetical protein
MMMRLMMPVLMLVSMAAVAVADVRVVDDGQAIIVSVDDKPVLRYNHAFVPSTKADAPWFGRSGYIHPIYTPGGTVVTDDQPADHYHQHGIMSAWTNTTFEGRSVDFWNSASKQGRVEHVGFDGPLISGPDCGGFTAKLRHVDLTAPGGEKVVLNETWTVRVYDHSRGPIIDLKSVQNCATDSPLILHEYRYGGFLVRGAGLWIKNDAAGYLTNEGKGQKEGDQQPAHWVAQFGPIDGQVRTLVSMGHPENFRAPQPARLAPGIPSLIWSPPRAGEFTIEPGKPYVTRFRFIAVDGEPKASEIDALWREYAAAKKSETTDGHR